MSENLHHFISLRDVPHFPKGSPLLDKENEGVYIYFSIKDERKRIMNNQNLQVQCVGMSNNGKFPLENTGRGADISPEFILADISPDAKTVAVTLEDISHPIFKDFTHWIIFNIPASSRIDGAIPRGKRAASFGNAIQGRAYGWHRYAGPKPPKGKRHQYRFTIYTLDCSLPLSPAATKKKFLKAAESHILQKGTVSGFFA